jgi:hypothetical protein
MSGDHPAPGKDLLSVCCEALGQLFHKVGGNVIVAPQICTLKVSSRRPVRHAAGPHRDGENHGNQRRGPFHQQDQQRTREDQLHESGDDRRRTQDRGGREERRRSRRGRLREDEWRSGDEDRDEANSWDRVGSTCLLDIAPPPPPPRLVDLRRNVAFFFACMDSLKGQ